MSEQKEVVVSVKNLSKRYLIGNDQSNDTIRDSIVNSLRSLVSSEAREKKKGKEFWALKDVTFDVYKGETLGIIGSNGAGKSTALKILSKIVEPTEGSIFTKGRVASLLEVGTGFHPELTGRENVFFNGSVLGMSKSEIQKRFDEIVAFSEIGKFIDTPVKFYSSGMHVRLGFAIAAHLDPDVLIIDEALAVGDVNFQQKCLSKMRDTARSGSTVIFVTHAMNIVEEICDRAVYLRNGQVVEIGDTSKIVGNYLGTTTQNLGTAWTNESGTYVHEPDNPIVPIRLAITKEGSKKTETKSVGHGENVKIELDIEVDTPTKDMSAGISLYDEFNNRIFRSAPTDLKTDDNLLQKGFNSLSVKIPLELLREGSYIAALDCDVHKKGWVHNPYHTPVRVKFFLRNDGTRPLEWDVEREGITKPLLQWEQKK